MRTLHRVAFHRASLCLGLLPMLLSGCTDTVFRDREPFNPPPDAENKFLGYFTASEQQTTCGNCHVLHQKDWLNTAHASAYSLLAGNSDATDACFTCHTVSDRGNAVAAPAGWDKVQDTAYHDVQCESCHGPGLDHVTAPDAPKSASNPPLAHVGVLGPSGAGDSASVAQSCGACHNQNSGPGVRAYEEWAASAHAKSLQEEDGTFVNDVSPTCGSCHEGRKALAAWGVSSDYVERDLAGSENYLGQTCAVCHDPHGTAEDPSTGQPIEHQLRFPISTPDINENLCMKCHQRRSEPDQASSRGPHSPQGPMLLGDAGYKPAGFDPDLQAVATTHGSEKNPDLCAGCHVLRLEGTDVTTGKPAVSAGHLFLAIPCLDAGGLPDLVNRDCAHDVASRSWTGCTASGCHGDATVAVSAFTLSDQRLDQLTESIWKDVNGNDAIDPDSTACSAGARRIRAGTVTDTVPCANPTLPGSNPDDAENRANWDAGLLARTDIIPIITGIPTISDTSQYVTNDATITPAEGARFNVRMLREGGSDGSHGVHNPFLAEALLRANIEELQAAYPGLPALRTSIQNILDGPLGAVTKRPRLRPLIARPISSR
jgi:hypothetical protein